VRDPDLTAQQISSKSFHFVISIFHRGVKDLRSSGMLCSVDW
jgi:hypothetical protein